MKTQTKTRTIPKTPFFAAFSVGAVLFSAHAGGGFATGNQANTYYVGLGWAGIVSAIVAMLLLTLTMREAMIMYNSRGLTSYKQLFETLYHPFDKIEWLFLIFFFLNEGRNFTQWCSWPPRPPFQARPPRCGAISA